MNIVKSFNRVCRAALPTIVLAAAMSTFFGIGVASASLNGFTVPAQSPTSVTPGGTATFSPITVPDTTSHPTDYVKLSVTSSLPTGAAFVDTADGSPTAGCVVQNGSQNYVFNNAKITTTGSTASGTYPFTVTANRYTTNNCTGTPDSTNTGTGSLVVQNPVAPTITSGINSSFATGTAGSFTITTTGTPTVTSITDANFGACVATSLAGTGLALNYTSGSSGTITSTSVTPAGTYIFCLNASNGVSPTATQTFTLIVGTATTTAVVSSVNPSTVNQSVTYTATVSGGPTSTGTVNFTDNGTTITGCGTQALTAGVATCTPATYAASGSHPIVAIYSGTTSGTLYAASTSATLTQTVGAATTTVVISSANPSAVNGAVTYTATVSGGPTTTGTVTFTDNGTTITGCSGRSLTGSAATCVIAANTYTTSGTHPIVATYSGTSTGTLYGPSTSATFNQYVGTATTTAVVSSVNPSTVNQSVTYTATVSGGPTSTGTVNFTDNGTTITGCGTQALTAGVATCTPATYAASGSHPIVAIYSGTTSGTLYGPSTSATLTQTVGAATTTVVISSANPSAVNGAVTYTATVSGGPTTTGTVTFTDNGTTITGCSGRSLTGSAATCVIAANTYTTSGTHPIVATYSGTSTGTLYGPSTSATFNQYVGTATTTAVVSSVNPSTVNQSVTYTATVSGGPTSTGTVNFTDNGTTITGCGTQALTAGVATCTPATYAASGSHPIVAIYSGTTSGTLYAASTSATLTQTVGAATTTVVISSANPSAVNGAVTYTATVSGGPTTTGTVTFTDNGTTITGCSGRSLTGSAATCVIAANTYTTSGTHPIVATYSGTSTGTLYGPSTSATFNQYVGTATTTAVVSSVNPSTVNQSVTYTATVSGGPTSTGTVNFTDNGTTITGCGTQALTAGVATCTPATYAASGSHPIVAIYSGTTSGTLYGPSTSATLTQRVNVTLTTVTSSANPSVVGQTVTYQATVSSASGTPNSGNVEFFDGVTPITSCGGSLGLAVNTGGIVNCVIAANIYNTAGSHTITAQYLGSTGSNGFSPSPLSSPITQVVNAANTTTVVVSATGTPSIINQSVTYTGTVTVNGPGSGSPTGTIVFFDGGTSIASCNGSTGLAVNGSGVATCVIPTNTYSTPGSHTITAQYVDGINYNTSAVSAAITQVVDNATTTAVISNGNPSVVGQSVTYQATVTVVSPGTGTPTTGNIEFLDGGNAITSCGGTTGIAVDGFGQAVCTPTTYTSVGSHTITVKFLGTTNYAASAASSPIVQVVGMASTNTAVASGTNPSVINQAVTYTGTVTVASPGSGTPTTGNIEFLDGGTAIASCGGTSGVAVNGSGVATCNIPVNTYTTTGSHTITAQYLGSANFAASGASAPLTQVVNRIGTTTTVVSSVNPSTVNQSVTYTGTVSSTSGTPIGNIEFLDGGTAISSCNGATGVAVNGSGVATCVIPASTYTSAGSHAITAQYLGSTTYATSTSTTLTQNVAGATTTTLASNGNPSVVGQSVSYRGTVSSGSGTPTTGNIEFFDGGTAITACGGTSGLAVNGFGQATCVIATNTYTTSGSHIITAQYLGSSGFPASALSSPLTQVVNPTNTAIAVVSSANPSVVGQPVTYTATASASSPGSGNPPTGNIEFFDGGTAIASCGGSTGVAVNGSGVATCVITYTATGSHTITVKYLGSSSFNASALSSPVTQVVNAAATTTVVVSTTGTPSVVGQSVTYTATASASSPSTGNPPTGNIEFFDGGTPIATCNGAAGVTVNGSGVAICVVPTYAAPGSHTITAQYLGSANYNVSAVSASITQVVNAAATTTVVVSSSGSPSLVNASVIYTGTVTVNSPGSGTLATGNVEFFDGATAIASCGGTAGVTVNGSGVATCTIPVNTYTAAGSHTITAKYLGSANFAASPTSASINQIVQASGAPSTTTALITSVNPSTVNQAVTYTATVSSGALHPGSGNVEFFDGGVAIASCGGTSGVAVSGSGVASCAIAANTYAVPGTHTITAQYLGSTTYAASPLSASLAQVVSAGPTTTVVVSSVNPSVVGQSVTYTATVSSGAVHPATGSIEFFDGGTAIASCGGTSGVSINGSGVASCVVPTYSSTGTHTITAKYLGSTTYAASALSASLAQVVNNATTTAATLTTLVSGTNPYINCTRCTSNYGITFTATVTSNGVAVNAAGSVTFTFNGSAISGCTAIPLSSSGVATCNATLTPGGPGAFPVVATYSGTSAFQVSSSSIQQDFGNSGSAPPQNSAPTSTALVSSTNPSTVNGAVTYTATVTTGGVAVNALGTVTFTDNGSTLCATVGLNSSGVATCSVLANVYSTASSHTIVATYSGTTTGTLYLGSANTITQVVVASSGSNSTTTTLNSVTSPVVYNAETQTFSGTVTGVSGDGYPIGSVSVWANGTLVCTSVLGGGVDPTANYSCALGANGLGVGSYSVTAVFAPASSSSSNALYSYATSNSTAQTVVITVATAATTTTLNAVTTPVVYGLENQTFTGTVTGVAGDGYPLGTVNVYAGATLVCTSPLSGGSGITASFSCALGGSTLGAGTFSITAVFEPATPSSSGGNAAYATSTSTAASLVVSPAVAVSGQGTLTISPSTVIVGTQQTLTMTFTAPANASFPANSSVQITVPNDWTTPTTGNTTLVAGTCTPGALNVPSTVDPGYISVTMACAAGTSFEIVLSSVSSTTVGTDQFATMTQVSGSAAAAVSPVPTVNVAQVATSGQGTMTVTPAWTTAGSTNNQLVFTFTAPGSGSFPSGSTVEVDVPADWTAPTSLNTSATDSSGNCSLGTLTFSGQDIFIPMACLAGASFTLNYGNALNPVTAGDANLAGDVFTTFTSAGPGLGTNISPEPFVIVKIFAPTVVVDNTTTSTDTGDTLIFTATVTGTTAAPTGTIAWTITGPGGLNLCPSPAGPFSSSNVSTYTCTIANAMAGSYTATANYGGDGTYGVSSGSDSATVVPATSGNVVTDNVTGLVTGGTLIFTATITGTTYAPTGTVGWTITGPGGLSVCPASAGPFGSGNTATFTCTIANALPGLYTAVAAYSGDSNYTGATSTMDSATVGSATPTNVVTDNVTGLVTGGTLIFTSTITGTTYTPTGSVVWTITGPGALSACPSAAGPFSSGNQITFTCTITNALPGLYTAQSAFTSGDNNYTGATSKTDSATVGTATPTNEVTDNVTGLVTGGTLIFTATVTGTTYTPTGSVGWTITGPGALSACPAAAGPISSGNQITFTCTITGAAAGLYTAQAAFSSADSNYTGATSLVDSATVGAATPPNVVTDNVAGLVTGGTVVFTATVTGNTITPTGSVGWTITGPGGLNFCPTPAGPTASGASITFTCTITGAAAGPYTAQAVFTSGDANYKNATSNVDSVTLSIPSTTTTITATSPDPDAGSPILINVNVVPVAPGMGVPTGTVTVSDGSQTCSAILDPSGNGSCSITENVATNYTFTATYNSDGNYKTSTSAGTSVTVGSNSASQITLATSCGPTLVSGAICTVTATLKDAYGNPVVDGSTVTFAQGGSDTGTVSQSGYLDNGDGTYRVTLTGVTDGTVSITASDSGDGVAASTTSVDTTVVSGAGTQLVVTHTSCGLTLVSGAICTVTVTLEDSNGNPVVDGSTVTFAQGGSDTGTVSQSGYLDNGDGTYRVTLTGVTDGTVSITASDSGDGVAASTTSVDTTVVSGAGTQLVVTHTSCGLTLVSGAICTVTVTLEDSNGNPVVDGSTVTFAQGGSDTGTVSQSGYLDNGDGTYRVTLTGVTDGTVSITASDSGDGVAASTTSVDTTVVSGAGTQLVVTHTSCGLTLVSGAICTVTVTLEDSNGNPVVDGSTVTFAQGGSDTGTVSQSGYLDNGDGTYRVTLTGVTDGTVSITASDSGDGVAASTTSVDTTVVSGAGTQLVVTHTSCGLTLVSGAICTVTVTLEDSNGNPVVDGSTVTFAQGGSDTGTVSQSGYLDNGDGTYRVTLTGVTDGTVSITASDSGDGVAASTTSVDTTVVSGAGTQLVVTHTSCGLTLVSGAICTVTVTLEDSNGNPVVDGSTVTFAQGGSDTGTVSQSGYLDNGDGTYRVTLTGVTDGTVSITASDSGDGVAASTTSVDTTVVSGAGTQLVVTHTSCGLTLVSGAICTVTVTLEDSNGNPVVDGSTVTFAQGGSDTGTVSQSGYLDNGDGTYRVTLTGVTDGTVSITASDSGDGVAASTTSVDTTVVSGAGTQLVVTHTSCGLTLVSGAICTVTVTLEDSNGNPVVDGSTVTFAQGGSDTGTVSQSGYLDNGDGTYRVTLTGVTDGTVSITASDSGDGVAASTTSVDTTVVSGAGTQLVVTHTSCGLTLVSGAICTVTVTLEDSNGNPVVDGSTVTFAQGGSDTGTVSQSGYLDNGDGTYRVTLTGVTDGTVSITASDSGDGVAASTTSVDTTVVSGAGTQLVVTHTSCGLTLVSGAICTVTVTLEDSNGNPVVDGSTVTFAQGGSDTGTVSQSGYLDNGDGTYRVTLTGVTDGTVSITASDSGDGVAASTTSVDTTVVSGAGTQLVVRHTSCGLTLVSGAICTVTVTLEDSNGNPVVDGSTVTFAQGGSDTGTVSQSGYLDNGDGTYRVTLTGVTDGTVSITASDSGDGVAASTTSVDTTVVSGAGTQLVVTHTSCGLTLVSGAICTVTVTLEDSNGNPVVDGSTVTFAQGGSDTGTVSQSGYLDNGDGTYRVTLTGVTDGTVSITASDSGDGVAASTTSVDTTVVSGAGTQLVVRHTSCGLTLVSGAICTVTVTLEDSNGNPVVDGSTVTFAQGGSDTGTVSQSGYLDNGDGTYRVTLTGVTDGTVSITASDSGDGVAASTTSVDTTVVSGAGTQLVVTHTSCGLTLVSGAICTVTVTLEDSNGNPVVDGSTVTFAQGGSDTGTVSQSGYLDNGDGTYRVTLTGVTDGTVSITASDSGDGVAASTTSVDTTVVSGAGTQLVVTHTSCGLTLVSGAICTVTVTLEDSNGNPVVDGSTVTFAQGGSDTGTVSQSGYLDNGDGTYRVTLTGVTDGTVSITASDSGDGVAASTTSVDTTVVSGAGTQLVVTHTSCGLTLVSGAICTVTVTLEDSNGNPVVDGSTVTFAQGGSDTGTVSQSGYLDNGDGTYRVTLTGVTDGTVSITASDSGDGVAASTTSVDTTVVSGAGTQLVVTHTSCGLTLVSGAICTVTVTLEDSNGNPVVDGSTVTFAQGGSDTGTVSQSGYLDNGDGTYRVTLTGVTDGTVSITASDSGDGVAASTTSVDTTVVSGAGTQLVVTHTSCGLTLVSGAICTVTVTLEDSNGNPVVDGSTVTFAQGGSDTGTVSQSGYLDNGDGTYRVTLTGVTDGTVSITASDSGDGVAASTTSVDTTVVSGAGTQLVWIVEPGSTVAGLHVSGPPTVEVLDAQGNPVSGATVTMAITSGPGTFAVGSVTSEVTGADGTAVFTTLILETSGSYTFTASDPATIYSPVSGVFNVSAASATYFTVSAPASATAGASFTVTVTAYDQYGNVATGYTGTVHFASSDTGLGVTLPANYTFTGADAGVHTFNVTLVTAGTKSVTATDTGNSSITGSANVNVSAASATHFTVSAPASATAGASFTVRVTAYDQYGNVATGYTGTVHFASSDTGLGVTLPANYTFTGADAGVHTFNVTLVTAGTKSVTATDTGNSSITGSANVNVSAASATHFTVSAPASATAGASFTVTVTAYDQYGNVATGYTGTVHFASSDTGLGVTLPANYTFTGADAGVHTFNVTLVTAGTKSVTATDTGNSSITGSANVNVSAASATHFTVSAPASATAGASFTVTVTAYDQYGNVATGYTGTVHFASSDTGLGVTLPANYTFTGADAGVHTFNVTLVTAGTKSVTATDTGNSSITGSANVNVSAASATHFTVSAPASATAGASFTVTVTAYDQYGNVATGYTGTVHFASSDTGLGVTLPANYTFTGADAGVHTFNVTLVTAGTKSVTATDTGNSSITGSANVNVSAASATHFTVSAPASATAGASFTVRVTAYDQYGNVATGYTGTVHFASSDTGLGVTLPANYTFTGADAGVHTFNVTLVTAGTKSVTATDTGNSSITGSANVNVSAASATHFTVSAPASATAGASFTVTVTAYDQYGNVATGYTGTVRFATSDSGSGASVPANYTFTGADAGVHTFSVTFVTAPSQTVSVTDTVNSSITGAANVTVTGSVATATHFTVSAPASATAGASFTVTVTAYDQYGNVATGYTGTVHFASSDTGLGVTLPANYTFTGADAGVHTFNVTLVTAGTKSVTATDTGNSSITGSANVNVSAASATHFTVSAPASATAGASFTVTVTAYDQYGNVATGYTGTVHFASSDTGLGVTLPANYTFTGADAGVHTFNVTLVTAGTKSVTATDTGNSSITGSANVNVSAASATHFTVSAPASATAGASFTVTVTAYDQYGNVATGYTGTVHFASSDTGLGVTLPANYTFTGADAGVHTFNVTLVTAGTKSVTATDTGNSSITGSANVNVSAASATKIVVTSGSGQSATVGTAFALKLVVTVTDAYGNPVSGVTVTFVVPASGASATFAGGVNTAVTGSNGQATSVVFTANGTSGGYNITASGPLTGTVSFAATNTVATKVATTTTLSISGSSETYGDADNATLTATVIGSGSTLPSGTVTFMTGSTVLCSTTSFTSSGSHTITASCNAPDSLLLSVGTYPVIAIYSGNTYYAGSSSSSVSPPSITVAKDTSKTTVSESSTSAKFGSENLVTFSAKVVTGNGEIAVGDSVTIKVGSVTCPVATTNASGVATCTIGSSALPAGGGYAVSATFAGDSNITGSTSTNSLSFSVTAPPVFTSATSASATVGHSFTFQVKATGYPAPTFAIKSGSLPRGVTFNTTTGVLTGTPASGTRGTYTLTITATNSAGTATQTFKLTVT